MIAPFTPDIIRQMDGVPGLKIERHLRVDIC